MPETNNHRLTLDQQRAQFAWKKAKDVTEKKDGTQKIERYASLTKSASAFIMTNGLMQTLAFYQSRKNAPESKELTDNLIEWIIKRMLPGEQQSFEHVMKQLYKMPSTEYMQATRESLAMLRWLRQFADALSKETANGSTGD